jgi:hypothetical protein
MSRELVSTISTSMHTRIGNVLGVAGGGSRCSDRLTFTDVWSVVIDSVNVKNALCLWKPVPMVMVMVDVDAVACAVVWSKIKADQRSKIKEIYFISTYFYSRSRNYTHQQECRQSKKFIFGYSQN